MKEEPAEYMVSLPPVLAKRAIKYNGHHYIRVKWVVEYIRQVREAATPEPLKGDSKLKE